jgi:N-acetylneuraminic acid mutarotase
LQTFVYNDLYFYNIPRNEWVQVKAPGGPPPRCSHQTVALSADKGQLWVFGGEYASPTQSQFYHYNDLWVYHMSMKKWEKIR